MSYSRSALSWTAMAENIPPSAWSDRCQSSLALRRDGFTRPLPRVRKYIYIDITLNKYLYIYIYLLECKYTNGNVRR